MKIRNSLHLKAVTLLFVYLLSLTTLCLVCFNAQFGIGWEALFRSPVGDRFDNIADAISTRLRSSPRQMWDVIINNFSHAYGAKFYLVTDHGQQLAGDSVELPEAVARKVCEVSLAPPPLPPFLPPFRPLLHNQDKQSGFIPPSRDGLRPRLIDGTSLVLPPNLQELPSPKMPVPSFLMRPHGRFMVRTENPARFWLCTRVGPVGGENVFAVPCVLIATFDNIWQSGLLIDLQFILLTIALVAALTLAFWWPFIHYITNELSKLTLATERIADGRFDTRIKAGSGDEIGRLSQAVNLMAGRLEGFVSGQRRFLGDISHELLSPMARLQIAVELLASCRADDRNRLIADIEVEIEEMMLLVNELLAFSKAGLKGKRFADLQEVKFLPLLNNLISKLHQASAIVIDVPEEIVVLADPMLLERAVSNVLRNSLRYAGNAGPITVESRCSDDVVCILIKDCGPGVPEQALSSLGEPFFRPEASRSRDSGGVGLGLAIVKSCIEACDGKLSVRNGNQCGLEVEMRLKLFRESLPGEASAYPFSSAKVTGCANTHARTRLGQIPH
jgi:two-component system sensor histidine kinase CpxA